MKRRKWQNNLVWLVGIGYWSLSTSSGEVFLQCFIRLLYCFHSVVVGSGLPDTEYWLGFSNRQEGSGCRQLGYLGSQEMWHEYNMCDAFCGHGNYKAGLWSDCSGLWFPARTGNFSVLQNIHTSPGAYPTFYSVNTGRYSSLWVRVTGAWADHSSVYCKC